MGLKCKGKGVLHSLIKVSETMLYPNLGHRLYLNLLQANASLCCKTLADSGWYKVCSFPNQTMMRGEGAYATGSLHPDESL